MKIVISGEFLLRAGGYSHLSRSLARLIKSTFPDWEVALGQKLKVQKELAVSDKSWEKWILTSNTKDPNIVIHVAPPPQSPILTDVVNGIYFTWETTKLPTGWIKKLDSYNFILVPSKAVKTIVSRYTSTPVYVVYPEIEEVYSPEGPKHIPSPLDDNIFKVCVSGAWLPRNNMGDAITAFCAAFNGMKDVALILKTWEIRKNADFRVQIRAQVQKHFKELLGATLPRVVLLDDSLEAPQYAALLRGCNAYMSTTHGDGINLGLIQAINCGLYAMSHNFLGQAEYDKHYKVIPYQLTPIYASKDHNYTIDQQWARIANFVLVTELQRAYNKWKVGKLPQPKPVKFSNNLNFLNEVADKWRVKSSV